MFVVQTDAPCRRCEVVHGYVTSMCQLAVFQDWATAHYIASTIEGASVKQIEEIPDDVSVTIFTHKDMKPDPTLPKTVATL